MPVSLVSTYYELSSPKYFAPLLISTIFLGMSSSEFIFIKIIRCDIFVNSKPAAARRLGALSPGGS